MQISRAQMALSPDTAANLFPLNGVSAASNSSVPHSFYIQKRAVVAHLVAQGMELLGKSDLLWTGSATPQTLTQIGHDLVKLRQVVAPHLDSRILGTREVQQSLADLMRSSDDMRLDILTSLSIYSRLRKYRTAHHFFSRSDYGFD